MFDASIQLLEHGEKVESLKELLRDTDYRIHLPCGVSHESIILPHGAVVSQKGDLVDVGSFIRTDDEVSLSLST